MVSKNSGVKSNFVKFNKQQEAIIKQFRLTSLSTMRELALVIRKNIYDDGFVDLGIGGKVNNPIKVKGVVIENPVQPKKKYERFKNRPDDVKKKYVIRTGKLRESFKAIPTFTNSFRNGDSYGYTVEKNNLIGVNFGFSGRSKKILLSHLKKTKTGTRRRIIEKGMSKSKTLWKKIMLQNIAKNKRSRKNGRN